MFCSNTTTGELKEEGDLIFMPNLVTTLEGIANQGPDYLYENPTVTVDIINEIKQRGTASGKHVRIMYTPLKPTFI